MTINTLNWSINCNTSKIRGDVHGALGAAVHASDAARHKHSDAAPDAPQPPNSDLSDPSKRNVTRRAHLTVRGEE
jgi:hypothetical protein